MTPEETAGLLRLASTLLDKPVPPGQPEAWPHLFRDVDVAYARIALADHCSMSEFWPTPASIIVRAKTLADADAAERKRAALTEAAREPEPDEFAPNPHGIAKLRYVLEQTLAAPAGSRQAACAEAITRYDELHGPGPYIEPRRNPCANELCQCTHTEGCEAGWIEQIDGKVLACQTCKPRTHAIQTNATSRREMGKLLRLPPEKPNESAQQW